MPIHPFYNHPLAHRLTGLGFRLEPWRINAGGMIAGLQFFTRSSEIVIGFDAPDTLRVILYKRRQTRQGASSAFQDFVWLIFEAGDHGIAWVTGVVSPQQGVDDDTLPAEKIAAFYTRYLGAGNNGYELGSEIILGEIAQFHRSWKRRPKTPRPPEEDSAPIRT